MLSLEKDIPPAADTEEDKDEEEDDDDDGNSEGCGIHRGSIKWKGRNRKRGGQMLYVLSLQ